MYTCQDNISEIQFLNSKYYLNLFTDSDTPYTDWDTPRTIRDRIRCAYRDAGRQYPIRDTVHYPMAHDIVRPLEDNGHVIEWWSYVKDKQHNHYKTGCSRIRTQSSCL